MTRVRPPYTLKVAETKDEIEACYDIRVEVFSVEQGFPLDTEIDEYDPISVHFLLTTPIESPPPESTSSLQSISPSPSFASASASAASTAQKTTERPIGTIRFVPGLSKLTRLAVHKEYRTYGFGKLLVEELEKFVKANAESGKLGDIVKVVDGRKVVNIKSHSQLPVKPFYARLGYVEQGEEFDEDGAPHQLMVHAITIS